MTTIRKNDRVRLLRWHLYKGEAMPDLPADQWTAQILETWGTSQTFAKVKRDHDGRVLPVLEKEYEHISDQESATLAPAVRRKRTEDQPTDEPVLF